MDSQADKETLNRQAHELSQEAVNCRSNRRDRQTDNQKEVTRKESEMAIQSGRQIDCHTNG